MNVCDMCSAALAAPAGYLLTTRQVVSNPAYWEFAFSHQWSYVDSMPDANRIKGGLAEQQARQTTPWLLCAECAGRLGTATAEAREHAQRWWASGEAFVPPGSGPVPVGEVRLTRPASDVVVSGIPRPARALVYGRGFLPGTEELQLAVQGLVMLHKGKLTRAHFVDIPVECESRAASNRDAFFSVVDEFRRSNPGAFVLDSLALDQRQGRDTAIIAVWEGAAAENARARLARPGEEPAPEADAALVQRHRYSKVQRTRESTFLLIFIGLLAPAALLVPWVQAHPEPNATPPAILPISQLVLYVLFGVAAVRQWRKARRMEAELQQDAAREGNHYCCRCGKPMRDYSWIHYALCLLFPWGLIALAFKLRKCRQCGRPYPFRR